MDYDLYHDESKENGYWHGILLVPVIKRDIFLKCLDDIRQEVDYPHFISLKGLKDKGRDFNCIRSWIQLGVAGLMQYFKNNPYPVLVGGARKFSQSTKNVGRNYKEIISIDCENKIIGAKFILFKERDSHCKMGDGYPDLAAKIETTLRMATVGGIHWLGDDENPIKIKSIHFDGHEHYGRNIDKDRIIGRICGLRDYCSIDKDLIIDDRISNHKKKDCQTYEDCQFLQLTDLLVGGFRTILGETKNDIQKEVAFPISELVIKWQGGYSRMKNSRWFKGFWMSESWIDSDKWNFGDFVYKNIQQKVLF